MLQVEKTIIDGCYVFTPEIHHDTRGFFYVPYNYEEINSLIGQEINFIQDNQSYSKHGVIRGLHFQKQPFAQTKLVRCIVGTVRDVIVDIRKNSQTYGKSVTVDISDKNFKMVLIPKGCAHGFSVLSAYSVFHYKVDAPYDKNSEECIRYNDPTLGIDWGVLDYVKMVSEKDKGGKFLKDINF